MRQQFVAGNWKMHGSLAGNAALNQGQAGVWEIQGDPTEAAFLVAERKLGIDATNKLPPETEREWGRPMAMDPQVVARIDELWPALGLAPAPGVSP